MKTSRTTLHICMLTAALFFGCHTPAAAEDSAAESISSKEVTVSGGVKADAIFLNFLKKGAKDAFSIPETGAGIGGYVNIDFNDHIGIQPELNLTHKRSFFGWNDKAGRFTSWGIDIPIYVVTGWDVFKNDRIHLGIGPFTEFGYSARWKTDGRKVELLEVRDDGEPMIRESQSGFAAMFGYEFGFGLRINVTYRICITDMLQPNISQGVRLYPQTASFGIAYNFRNRKK